MEPPITGRREPRDMANWMRTPAQSIHIGYYNRGLVLEAIRLRPGTSRTEVARHTGLTSAAVSTIVRGLIQDGLVGEGSPGVSTGGKPPASLHVRRGAGYALGIHFDPAVAFVVLADLDGTVVDHARIPTADLHTPREVVARLAVGARTVLARANVERHGLLGVCVASPGPFDATRRVILNSPHFGDRQDVPIADMLEDALELDVLIENDANAAAIGEMWVGVARDVANFLYVYLGSGTGGALFINHELYRGCTGHAGAIAHVTVEPDGALCPCGNRGCLGTVSSCAAIVQAARGLPKAMQRDLGLSFDPQAIDDDHRKIIQAAAAGERHAVDLLERPAQALARAAVSLINVLDLDHVVLGGHAIDGVQEIYLDAIRKATVRQPHAHPSQHIHVAASRSDDLAGAIGAASVVFHEQYTPHRLNYRARS